MQRDLMPCMKQSSKAGLHTGPTTLHPLIALPCSGSRHPLHRLQLLNPPSSSAPVWSKGVAHHLKDQTERVKWHRCPPTQVSNCFRSLWSMRVFHYRKWESFSLVRIYDLKLFVLHQDLGLYSFGSFCWNFCSILLATLSLAGPGMAGSLKCQILQR